MEATRDKTDQKYPEKDSFLKNLGKFYFLKSLNND